MRYYIEGTESIILSIQTIHAERIYSGEKLFELRKTIPKKQPELVFLYENSGKNAITGVFVVKRIISLELEDLWKLVGKKGTTRQRFFKYFDGYSSGHAYEIDEVIKFSHPLYNQDIIKLANNFRHPQSFVYLKSFPNLREKLFDELNKNGLKKNDITFEAPSLIEEEEFKTHALKEISKNYDEIDNSFVDNIVICARQGYDKHGYFTRRKILYSIKLSKKTIGFIVLTEKIGNSVKTGPTILLPEFRNKGLGREVRRQIEDIYKKLGYRKIYCTCNSTDFDVIRYLIKSGMKVEAHLTGQYKKRNSEFIFGKLLKTSPKKYLKLSYKKVTGTTSLVNVKKDGTSLISFLNNNFPKYYLNIDSQFVDNLIKSIKPKIGKYTEKNKSIFVTKNSNNEIISTSICSPKRGGSVKINYLTTTSDDKTLANHFLKIISFFHSLNRSKIYTTIPVYDLLIIKNLENIGFIKEGLLIEPYQDGIDMMLLSLKI